MRRIFNIRVEAGMQNILSLGRVFNLRVEAGMQSVLPAGTIAGKIRRKLLIFKGALNKVLEKPAGAF